MSAPKTPAEVAARGIQAGEFARKETLRTWDETNRHIREMYRDEARDALASLAASPDVREQVARAISDHTFDRHEAGLDWCRCGAHFRPGGHLAHQADAVLAVLAGA